MVLDKPPAPITFFLVLAKKLHKTDYLSNQNYGVQLDGSLPANPANDQRKANAKTLKSIFCLP